MTFDGVYSNFGALNCANSLPSLAAELAPYTVNGPLASRARYWRGFALWRRHASSPHWRAGLVERHEADEGIQEIQMSTTDLTGDDSDDALIFEGIGGSGA